MQWQSVRGLVKDRHVFFLFFDKKTSLMYNFFVLSNQKCFFYIRTE